jgi:hypothetical protein
MVTSTRAKTSRYDALANLPYQAGYIAQEDVQAFVKLSTPAAATLTVSTLDDNGAVLDAQTITLPANGHLQIAYVWHASVFTREVLDGLLRIGFLHHQQIIWNKGRTVLTRTHYWFQHEPCWYVRKKNAPWFGKADENSTIWDAAGEVYF